MIARSYTYRWYPTKLQAERLSAWQRAFHEIQRRIAWKQRTTLYSGQTLMQPQPSFYSQGPEVTQLRHADPFLADVPARSIGYLVV